MIPHKKNLLLLLIIGLTVSVLSGKLSAQTFNTDSVIKGMTQDETILYNMINDMRRQSKLSAIPISADLCVVAHVHIDDLLASRPQDHGCSLHSWSGSGKWTACCNSKDPAGIQCMKSKPKEITGYPGNGYELIYWGEDNATPADAADLWKQVDASSDMILSRAKWKGYDWKAIGVSIKDGFAILWLGDKPDKKQTDIAFKKPVITQQNTVAETSVPKPVIKESKKEKIENKIPVKEKTTSQPEQKQSAAIAGIRYFLIVSSVKTSDDALKEVARLKSEGYPDVSILKGEAVFRIALSSYDSEIKARARLNELKSSFPGIWIIKK
jgi:cell division septation protein DedD